MKDICLKVCNLKKYFPIKKNFFNKPLTYNKAVDDVSFNVYKNEILGIVGESGCGKTTLGRSVLRLIEPDSGSLEFLGKDITNLDQTSMREIRKKMQIIFQDPYSSLNPRKKIYQIIGEPLLIHSKINDSELRKIVAELLKKTKLEPEMMDKFPHQFSGGQRQRISIARSLAMKPELIICDEPVSALDVSVQAQILNLLMELKKNFNLTFIFISHDLAVIRQMADRILIMNNGKIIESGSNNEIFNNPQQEYTKTLLNSIPGQKRRDKKKE